VEALSGKDRRTEGALNRRITALILGFCFTSVAAAVLPLWPGIQEHLPVGGLGREEALGTYALFLLGFLGFLFPLGISRREDGDPVLPWFWVGGFMLAFAGVPLFVLAYIAGVHLKGVFCILLWGGVIHGGVLLVVRVLGFRARYAIPPLAYVLAVVLPADGDFAGLLGESRPNLSPFALVLDVARRTAEPKLLVPAALVLLLYGFIVLGPRWRAHKKALAASVLVLACCALGAATFRASAAPAARVFLGTDHWIVPGRVLPLRLEAPAGSRMEIRLGPADPWVWTPEVGGPDAVWIYPRPSSAGDQLRVTVDGSPLEVPALEVLPGGRSLVLTVGEGAARAAREGGVTAEDTEFLSLKRSELPRSMTAYEVYGAIVAEETFWESLPEAPRRAIEASVAAGGRLLLLNAHRAYDRRVGEGRLLGAVAGQGPVSLRPVSRQAPLHEENLYSNFGVPDWGRVDMTGLILFLLAYHVVFYLIFLLPLLIDARKSMAVYLTSVGFVLALEILGGWWGLKVVFLRENQTVEQDFSVDVLGRDAAGRPLVHALQLCGFASFNGQPIAADFETENNPVFVPRFAGQNPGRVNLRNGGRRLHLPALPLDRFQNKQVVRLDRVFPSPLDFLQSGDSLRLDLRGGVADVLGLQTARRVGGFVRRSGRLHAVTLRDGTWVIDPQPAPLSWSGVLPESYRGEALPFIRWALGRAVSPREDVLVVILEDTGRLKPPGQELLNRSIAHLLMIPLEP